MVNQTKIGEIYGKYHSLVNMTFSELKAWSENPLSYKASLDRSPIHRNLHLLSTLKADWGLKEINWANKTIAFISRMSKAKQGGYIGEYQGHKISRRDVSLLNWANFPYRQ